MKEKKGYFNKYLNSHLGGHLYFSIGTELVRGSRGKPHIQIPDTARAVRKLFGLIIYN